MKNLVLHNTGVYNCRLLLGSMTIDKYLHTNDTNITLALDRIKA